MRGTLLSRALQVCFALSQQMVCRRRRTNLNNANHLTILLNYKNNQLLFCSTDKIYSLS